MEGCRYPMPWSKDFKNTENYRLYKKMTDLRKENEVLRNGSFKFLYSEGRISAFARFDENKVFVGIISKEDSDRKIRLPLSAIGAKTFKTEIFGKDSEVSEDEILIKAGESYLFECEMK